jgi:hypothetical protein
MIYLELKHEGVIQHPTRMLVKPGFYCRNENVGHELMRLADRVWKDDEKGVRYIKFRGEPETLVDMNEFFWIKLKAKNLQ